MNPGFDEGDFKKARGMLLSFSSILIAIWFFGADFKSMSVLGTKIAFTQNTQHIWLVALAINSYFLLRFYQHSPGTSYSDNKTYKNTFESFLIKSTRRLKKGEMKEDFFRNLNKLGGQGSENYKLDIVRESLSIVNNPNEQRKFIRGIAWVAKFHIRGDYRNSDATEIKLTPATEFSYPCSYWLIVLAIYRAKVLANIKTSLGTEYTMPYLWSGWATAICISQWLTVNSIDLN
ncbi:hypothetical protein [Pseudomonas fluorescens]|uniref:hypothetical protein n=1 Tax=Pseudomonas fluorescens TaxID=294 RepID=UPI0006966739|nr:hypothetical protein [Pseudomonas fluorescens]